MVDQGPAGAAADLASAGIDLWRGDLLGAFLGLLAALPVVGTGVGVVRKSRVVARAGEPVGGVLHATDAASDAHRAAGNVANIVQGHHAIPWNNKTWNHQNHPLVKQACNSRLDKMPGNVRPVEGHIGRHSDSYHREIRRRMNEAYDWVAGKGQVAAQKELDKVLKGIWDDIACGKLKPYDHKDVIVLP
jgi:hypothetical protein